MRHLSACHNPADRPSGSGRGHAVSVTSLASDQAEESAQMTTAMTLQDITIYPVVEQQGPFFDALEFFPTLTKELLAENRAWLEPSCLENGRLVLCVQS